MLVLYRLSIFFYHFLIDGLALFHSRARQFSHERKDVFRELENEFREHQDHVVWFHAASLGEYEQARPVIERLKAEQPETKVLLTFFSPSGYQVVKNQKSLDFVHYLPEDSPANACRFIALVKPKLAVFVKYELWYFFLTELKTANIPVLLISGIFRKNQMYFHPAGKFYLPAFQSITHYFLQDEYSSVMLRKLGISNYTISGDTRFDRVLEIADGQADFPVLEKFKGEANRLIILGSVWSSDMEHLWPLLRDYQDQIKFVIAPHEVNTNGLKEFENIDGAVFYSRVSASDLNDKKILVIDEMGVLSRMYRYADLAIVGGAFRGTLHNTLEPAVYGIPVLFGRHANNEKFVEAVELQNAKGAFTFENYLQLKDIMDELLTDQHKYKAACDASRKFVQSRGGASDKIFGMIKYWL